MLYIIRAEICKQSVFFFVQRGKRTFYLVKWVGWGSEDSTWEPHENLLDERILG